MKTIGIKMHKYTNEVNVINNNNIEKRIFYVLLVSFGFLSVLYVMFLGNMIFNIVERRNTESDSRLLANEVADLESKYLSMSSEIDLELSDSLGYKVAKVNFATRKSLGYNIDSVASKNEI